MRRFPRIALASTAFLLVATLARAGGPVPPGYTVAGDEALTGGVEHLTLSRTHPDQAVQVARITPGEPVALAAVSAHDAVPHSISQQELPSDMCKRVACIVGVNADFHDPDTDQPLGGVIAGGRMLRSPQPGADQVTVARDGGLQAGRLEWSGSVRAADGTTVQLSAVNADRTPGGSVLYTPGWGAQTPAGATGELVLRAAGPVGALETTTAVQIVGFRKGPGPVPADGAILSVDGERATVLAGLWGRVHAQSVSDRMELTLHAGAGNVSESLGVRPVLLRGGQRVFPPSSDGLTALHNPRTLLGWNAAREVVIVTVDGRRDDADGMTLAEACDLLLSLGATDGVNFDGGGGTTFVVNGSVTNLPSDPSNPGPASMPGGHVVAPGHVERLAPNALVVVPRAADPAPPTPDPGTQPGTAGQPGTGATTSTTGTGTTFDPVFGVSAPHGTTGSVSGDPHDIFGVAGDDTGDVLSLAGGKKGKRTHTKHGSVTDDTANVLGDWLDGVVPELPMPPGAAVEGQSALAAGLLDHHGEVSLVRPVVAGIAGLEVLAVAAALAAERRRRRRSRRAIWL